MLVTHLLLVFSRAAIAVSSDEPSFSRDVAPVLAARCLACHGPEKQESGYSVLSYEALLKPGDSSDPAITPGDPEASRLLALVAATDADERMPKEAEPLSAQEIQRIRQWIASGATFDGADPGADLASLVPATEHPAAPVAYARPLPVTALAFAPDGTELAVGGYHEITLWSVPDAKLVGRIGNVAERTMGLAYTPDGRQILAAGGSPGQSGELRIYSRADGALIRQFERYGDTALDLALSPAGDRVAVAGADRSVRVYDVSSGARQLLIEGHADWVLDVAWSPDGQKLATASRDKTAKVFAAADGELLTTYTKHGEVVFAAAFTADGDLVASGGRDRRVQLWNVSNGATTSEVGGFGGDLLALTLSGDQLVCGGADGVVRLHRIGADPGQGLALVRAHEGHADWINRLAFDESRNRFASGGHDGAVRIWNLADGQTLCTFTAAPGFAAAPEHPTPQPRSRTLGTD